MRSGRRTDGGLREPPPAGALYVFRVTFRLSPTATGIRTDPETFEATVYRTADDPGESGWLFFRDNLWRGELSAPEDFLEFASETLDVPVQRVAFSELRTTPAYLEALRDEIADTLEVFGDDTVDGVLSSYLGSSIHVVE